MTTPQASRTVWRNCEVLLGCMGQLAPGEGRDYGDLTPYSVILQPLGRQRPTRLG